MAVSDYSGYNPVTGTVSWDGGGYSTAVGNYTISGPQQTPTSVNPAFNWNAWADQPAATQDGGGGTTVDPNDLNGNGIPDWYEAQLERQRSSAYGTLYSMFKQWGIDMDGNGLAAQVKSWIWEDKSSDEVIMLFRNSDAYKARFTGMADLVKRGQFMNEADYIRLESDMRNVMASWGIPKDFYDEYRDFGKFIANGVSVKELDDRIKSAQTFLDTQAPQSYKDMLREMGISDTGLLAHVLDADRAQSIIQREMKAAAMGGAANAYGFGLDAAEAEKYASTLGDQFNAIGVDQRIALEGTLSKLGETAINDERLASIDREAFARTDILDAELLNDGTKRAASQRRGLREVGRFSGSSAVTTGSLSRNTGS